MSAKHTQGIYLPFNRYLALLLAVFLLGFGAGYTLTGNNSPDRARSERVQVVPGNAQIDTAEMEALKAHTQKEPENAKAWNALGHWYFDHQMPREAIEAYEISLRLEPDNSDIITDMGVMYRELHEHDKALELFRKAYQINPKHEQSRFSSGIVLYFDFDKKEEGLAVWKELLEMNPNFKTPNGTPLSDWVKEN